MSERDLFSGPEDVFNVMNAKLYLNNMQDKIKGTYFARAHEQVLTIEEIVDSAVRRGGATANPDDLLAHWHTVEREIAYQLCNGNAVRTWLFYAMSKISGMYDTPREGITEGHWPTFFLHASPGLKQLAKRVKINIEGVADSGAYLKEFHDVDTDTTGQMISPGGMCRITGEKIKIESGTEDKPGDTGVILVGPGSPAIRVKMSKLAVNEPGRLVGAVPEGLPADRLWNVEVRTRYSGSAPLKNIRVITAEWKLAVPAAHEAESVPASGSQKS
ncbi:MAG: DUF4469 domain-containing protein [Spirochaetaceae bacterium]|jgi:hypothetical protein|nr:DUF4469 domain-containing protein [Spirochaetaceae bacterium]